MPFFNTSSTLSSLVLANSTAPVVIVPDNSSQSTIIFGILATLLAFFTLAVGGVSQYLKHRRERLGALPSSVELGHMNTSSTLSSMSVSSLAETGQLPPIGGDDEDLAGHEPPNVS